MLYIHPLLQLAVTVLAGYVGWLGFTRFQARHLGRKIPFLWKRHARLGVVAISVWFMGLLGGVSVAWLKWDMVMVTGQHYKVALVMVPFMVFGLASGLYMDRKKKNGRLLALAHGLCNGILFLLALYQIWTGVRVARNFLS